jgi:hypothetical protein
LLQGKSELSVENKATQVKDGRNLDHPALVIYAGRAQVAEPKQTVNRQRVSGKSPPSNS